MGSDLLLILVVATALAFDFTNGFHDTANAMATSIATGALKPRVAVAISAVMNLIGAFVSIKVATTIATGIVDTQVVSGAVIGSGIGKRLASVRWGTAGQMVGAWILTIPGAAVIGAAAWEGATALRNRNVGIVIVAVLAAALAAGLWALANRTPVRARDLDRTPVPTFA